MENAGLMPAIETFIYKLSQLPAINILVRGSFVTRHWVKPYIRDCQDVDLLIQDKFCPDSFLKLMKDISNVQCELGVSFKPETIESKPIWEDSPAPGMRFFIKYEYQGESGELQVDTGIGDPLIKDPITVDIQGELFSKLTVRTVIPEIAVVWKIHGLFEHLSGWMPKTLWDIYILINSKKLNKGLLIEAINTAFGSRNDPICILKRLLYGEFGTSRTSRKSWRQFMQKQHESQQKTSEEVLTKVRKFLIPILEIENDGTLLTHAEVLNYRVRLLREENSEMAKLKLKTLGKKKRVLKWKAYESIPHLPESRTGSADRHIDLSRAAMLTSVRRYDEDEIIVQEKLDGSCVSAAKINGEIVALGRDGDLAKESPNEARRMWAEWVEVHSERFGEILGNGERIVGEWLALVHSTRYELKHEPFVAFDIFDHTNKRITYDAFIERCEKIELKCAALLHRGDPIEVSKALELLGHGKHNSIDPPEGVVYRLQRRGKFMFMAKYVKHGKIDGCYLPENTGNEEIWNWREK